VLVEMPVLDGGSVLERRSVVLEGTTLRVDEIVSVVPVTVAERQSVDTGTWAVRNAEPLTT
jgi:hypothetical protein